MKNIILSMGWSISSIFILASILYLFFNKKKNNNYNNSAYNLMIINLIIVLILEILSIYTISISSKIPIINEIVCRMYLFFVIISFSTLI